MKVRLAAISLALLHFVHAIAQSSDVLEVRNLEIVQTQQAPVVTGEARNVAGRTIRNATIRINLYDNSGRLVGNTSTQAANLEADRVWKFQAPASVRFDTAKVFEVIAN